MVAFGTLKLRVSTGELEETKTYLNGRGYSYHVSHPVNLAKENMVEIAVYVSADFEGEFSNLRPF